MTGLQWLEISKIAKEFSCLEDEFDEVYQFPVLDEDKLLDGLEETMCVGGNIVDYHSCEFFPERWFDVVFVLRTDNTLLYDRLVSRGERGRYPCPNCPKVYSYASSRFNHTKYECGKEPSFRCPVDQCFYKAKRKTSMKGHLKNIHSLTYDMAAIKPEYEFVDIST
ncbi:hypothetical protein HHI36_020011 [Cryptolaemus montrouzieri]|uniref:C2H2-type domain-containing protein n=1 Tax=Cryptolaemus montrouzieri TaxID=559131 RepID=A0ABD2N9G5_9CUCU